MFSSSSPVFNLVLPSRPLEESFCELSLVLITLEDEERIYAQTNNLSEAF